MRPRCVHIRRYTCRITPTGRLSPARCPEGTDADTQLAPAPVCRAVPQPQSGSGGRSCCPHPPAPTWACYLTYVGCIPRQFSHAPEAPSKVPRRTRPSAFVAGAVTSTCEPLVPLSCYRLLDLNTLTLCESTCVPRLHRSQALPDVPMSVMPTPSRRVPACSQERNAARRVGLGCWLYSRQGALQT